MPTTYAKVGRHLWAPITYFIQWKNNIPYVRFTSRIPYVNPISRIFNLSPRSQDQDSVA